MHLKQMHFQIIILHANITLLKDNVENSYILHYFFT